MTSPLLYVCFAGLRRKWTPGALIIVQPATSLEESVRLRAKDGTVEVVPTPAGSLLFRLHWLGCLDHIPDEEEREVLAQQLPSIHDDDDA